MKKFISIVVAFLVLAMTSVAMADFSDDPPILKDDSLPYYVGGSFFMTFLPTAEIEDTNQEINFNDTGILGMVAGKQIKDFRIEGAYNYQRVSLNEWHGYGTEHQELGDARIMTLMVNGYYTYPIIRWYGVYGMVGAGIGNYEQLTDAGDYDGTGLAYQIGAGVTYKYEHFLAVDVGFQWMTIDGADVGDQEITYESKNVGVTIRYLF